MHRLTIVHGREGPASETDLLTPSSSFFLTLYLLEALKLLAGQSFLSWEAVKKPRVSCKTVDKDSLTHLGIKKGTI